MVEIKSMQVHQDSFLGIHMHLPGYPLYLIMSTKAILAQEMFDIQYFHKEKPIAVMLVPYCHGFEEVLEAPIIAMNEAARRKGVSLHMLGKEALLLCEGKE